VFYSTFGRVAVYYGERACLRVSVACVCLSVCLSAHVSQESYIETSPSACCLWLSTTCAKIRTYTNLSRRDAGAESAMHHCLFTRAALC